jgi:hypothetical protein
MGMGAPSEKANYGGCSLRSCWPSKQMNKTQAEMLRIGLASGFLEMVSIVTWADGKIAAGADDFDYIQISTSKSMNDLVTALGDVQGEVNGKVLVHRFLGMLSSYLERNPAEYRCAIRALYYLLNDYRAYMSGTETSAIYSLDEGYDLAVQEMYGTLDSIRQELSHFLNSYKSKNDENFQY